MLIVLPTALEPSALAELRWVQSLDGVQATAQGQDPVALLPPSPDVVLAVPAPLLSWHRVTLPATGSARLRQVLDGLLEDRLLCDPGELHLALEPGLVPRQTGWVAACQRVWLTGWMDTLHAAGRRVVRIVPQVAPASAPSPVPTGWQGAVHALGQAWWVQAHTQGVWCTPLPEPESTGQTAAPWGPAAWRAPPAAPVWAEPALVPQAEALTGQPAQVQTAGERLLLQATSAWDLAQFDLRRSAGVRQRQQLLEGARALAFGPAWRATRMGLLACAVVGTAGLWAAAWQSQRQTDAQTQAVRQVLTATFPHVTLVLDAPLQMRREVERLQRASGVAGAADLERFLMDFSASAQSGVELKALVFENPSFTLILDPAAAEGLPGVAAGLGQRGWAVEHPLAGNPLQLRARRADPTQTP